MEDVVVENYLIRTASINDADTLALLSYQTFEETFAHVNSKENMNDYLSANCTTDVLAEELKDRASTFLIAYADKEPVGFAKLRWSETPIEIKDKKAVEIQRLYILKKMIGKKLGKILIEKCFEIALHRSFNTVWLGVWEHNDRAIAFYKKFGFDVFGSQIFELGRDRQTDLLMKKIL